MTRWEVTADGRWLEQAIDLGASTLDRMTADDQLWRAPPADAAALFRALLRVHAAEPQPRSRWPSSTATSSASGARRAIRRQGGSPPAASAGPPVGGPTLDHAALVRLFALQAG